jgi:hypothetical protein
MHLHSHISNYILQFKNKLQDDYKTKKQTPRNGSNKIVFRGYKPPIAMALTIIVVGSFELGCIVGATTRIGIIFVPKLLGS